MSNSIRGIKRVSPQCCEAPSCTEAEAAVWKLTFTSAQSLILCPLHKDEVVENYSRATGEGK